MFPYEVLVVGQEEYKDRLAEAERQRRNHYMHVDGPTLLDRTTLRLGDLLIAAGEHLKHQRAGHTEHQPDSKASRPIR